MERKLASIRRIKEIRNHPNADLLDLAIVDGWQLVTGKSNGFKVGGLCSMTNDIRYKLYLDDLRYPDLHPDWRIARNYHDAVWMVTNYGMPYFISFDHDLADIGYLTDDDLCPREFTGYDFAKWLVGWIMDNDWDPDTNDFRYTVHSANPVGAENIRRYMANFLRDRYV